MLENTDNIEAIIREVSILECCDHKNIVKVIDYGNNGVLQISNTDIETKQIYIVMEYVSGKTLLDYMQE